MSRKRRSLPWSSAWLARRACSCASICRADASALRSSSTSTPSISSTPPANSGRVWRSRSRPGWGGCQFRWMDGESSSGIDSWPGSGPCEAVSAGTPYCSLSRASHAGSRTVTNIITDGVPGMTGIEESQPGVMVAAAAIAGSPPTSSARTTLPSCTSLSRAAASRPATSPCSQPVICRDVGLPSMTPYTVRPAPSTTHTPL